VCQQIVVVKTSRGQGQNAVHTRKPGGKGQAGADVFAFDDRIISENLLRRHVPGQEPQDHAHRIAPPAHGGLAAANRRITVMRFSVSFIECCDAKLQPT